MVFLQRPRLLGEAQPFFPKFWAANRAGFFQEMNAALRSHAASFGAAPGAAAEWSKLAFCCVARMRPFDDRRGVVRFSLLRCAARPNVRPVASAVRRRAFYPQKPNRRRESSVGETFRRRVPSPQGERSDCRVDEGLPMGRLLPPARKKRSRSE